MTINYLKNKKYYILTSLFCLCYALGAQEVKAAKSKENKPISSELTYDLSNQSSPSYQIADFKDIREFYPYNGKKNIALFVGKSEQSEKDKVSKSSQSKAQQYIFITHNSIPQNSQKGKIQVTGFPVDKIDDDNMELSSQSGHQNQATLEASSKSLWGPAFIFSCKEANLTFYYRRGLLSDEFMEANAIDSNFYREKSNDSKKPIQVWEVVKQEHSETQQKGQTKDIVATWEVYLEDIQKIEKASLKGWLYSTLNLSGSDARPYIKLNDRNISYIVFFIVYCIFLHKAINKKAMQFVNKYILRKK